MKAAARYHHGDLRSALLASTVAIVRRDGPRAVTLRDVARRAGVSEAAPYHHFAGKSELLLAAAAGGYRALGERLGAAAGTAKDARGRLLAVCEAYVAFALDEPGYFRLLFGAHIAELVAEDSPAVADVKLAGGAAAGYLRETIAAIVDSDARRFERLVWSQIHGLAWLVLEDEIHPMPSRSDTLAMAREGIGLLVDGLGARRRAKRR